MKYVKIDNDGNVLKYPYTRYDFKKDNPTIALPKDYDLSAFENVEKVVEVNEPLVSYSEIKCEKIDGVFTEVYVEEEISETDLINNKINENKDYLFRTGWIWEKYNRCVVVLETMTNEEFKTKYSDIISSQEQAREEINSLEIQLQGMN